MGMKTKIALYLAIIVSCVFLLSCSKNNELDELNQRVSGLVKVIEERKESEITNFLSDDFLVVNRFNKKQFIFYTRYQFKRNKNISLSFLSKKIIHNENTTDITAEVLLLGAENWLPERGQIYQVDSRWVKEGGNWVVSRLRWQAKLQ